jgi:hypothetical protein
VTKLKSLLLSRALPSIRLIFDVPAVKEVLTVTGKVLSADDKPVVFAHVMFTSDKTDPTIDGSTYAMTDESGNFSLNVLKGLPGELYAFAMLDPKEFKECPARLQVRGKVSLDRRTETIRLQTDRRLDRVDLRFPFSSCNGQKIHSQMRID